MVLFDVGRVSLVDIIYDEHVSVRPRNRVEEYRDDLGQLHFQRLPLSPSGSTGKSHSTFTVLVCARTLGLYVPQLPFLVLSPCIFCHNTKTTQKFEVR